MIIQKVNDTGIQLIGAPGEHIKALRTYIENGNVQFWVELSDGREVFQCLSPVAIPEGFVDRSAVSSGAWEALAGSTPVALADLPNGACKWAIGDRPMLFCAEPVDGDKPYCSIHAALAYREPPPRKDNGRRDSA